MPLSYQLLAEQNANTTNAIIQHFTDNPAFPSLPPRELKSYSVMKKMGKNSKRV
jgi:hypothetical protein